MPVPGFPLGMGNASTVALGALVPARGPPLRVTAAHPALSMARVAPFDAPPGGGRSFVFDFGLNTAGMVRLSLPAGHGIPAGTQLRIEMAEIVAGPLNDTGGLCTLCPACNLDCPQPNSSLGGNAPCTGVAEGAVCNTYCTNPAKAGKGPANHALRDEPCWGHQSYTPAPPHYDAPSDRYIGDFNNANQTNVYVVRGDGTAETYTPFFAAGGVRYGQISNLPATFTPSLSLLTGLSVHSAVPSSGDLALPVVAGSGAGTPDVLNGAHRLTRASQLSNLWSVPTDCPQRERRGWMGDAQASSDEAMLNFDMQLFYEKFLADIGDDQARYASGHAQDTGCVPDVVPYDGIGGNPGCLVWQVAYIVIARNAWKHYGENIAPALARHWQGLVALSAWFDRHADPVSGLNEMTCYGDWMGFNPESTNSGGSALTPNTATSAFYHVLSRRYMAELAQALGRPAAEQAEWRAKYEAGQAAYHAAFFNATAGGYSPCINDAPPVGTAARRPSTCHGTSAHGSQCSNAMALVLGAPPTAEVAATVASNLAKDVEQFGFKTTTGVVGIAWLFPALDAAGHSDVALRVLRGDAYPSIGFMIAQNMTTLCENFACTFHDAGHGSGNHIMLGGFDAWMSASLGGLDSKVNGTTGGWKHIVARVAPAAITELKHASTAHETRFGRASLDWAWDAATAKLAMNLTVPIGATCEVHSHAMLQSESGQILRLVAVHEGGRALWRATADYSVAAAAAAAAVVHEVGSGSYRFVAHFDSHF